MQIIESTPWGVRSARLTLRHPTGGSQVVLFPMIHVGEAAFYRAVYEDAFRQDVVLVEGLRSPVATRITRSYRWLAGSRTLNLTIQPAYPPQAASKAKIVHADLSASEFHKHWRQVPLWLRVFVYLGAPAIGLWFRIFGTREKLASRMALDDAVSEYELLNWDPELGLLDRAILEARDIGLVHELNQHLIPSEAPISVAVVYGAAHMRAVLRYLAGQGYTCTDASWMTVFSLD